MESITTTLRRAIGWLGITFPLLLALGASAVQTSVSDYYYTNMRDYFEGVLFFLAVFLMAYRPYGKDGWQDNLITTLGGIAALLLALFPTHNAGLGHTPSSLVLAFVPLEWSGGLHNLGAGGLFLCFGVMSLFYFTKGPRDGRTPQKALRNLVYVGSGVGIFACIGFIASVYFTTPDQTARDLSSIYWPESIALVLFGLSWLVKGNQFPLLNDPRAVNKRSEVDRR